MKYKSLRKTLKHNKNISLNFSLNDVIRSSASFASCRDLANVFQKHSVIYLPKTYIFYLLLRKKIKVYFEKTNSFPNCKHSALINFNKKYLSYLFYWFSAIYEALSELSVFNIFFECFFYNQFQTRICVKTKKIFFSSFLFMYIKILLHIF